MITAPICPVCQVVARLGMGMEVYHHQNLFNKPIWICDGCGAYVGCHPGTDEPLGYPAGRGLRSARVKAHAMVDPLWKKAWMNYDPQPEGNIPRHRIDNIARGRVYWFLSEKLPIARDDTHIGMFDLATCQRVCAILEGVTFQDIRAWAHERHAQKTDAA